MSNMKYLITIGLLFLTFSVQAEDSLSEENCHSYGFISLILQNDRVIGQHSDHKDDLYDLSLREKEDRLDAKCKQAGIDHRLAFYEGRKAAVTFLNEEDISYENIHMSARMVKFLMDSWH